MRHEPQVNAGIDGFKKLAFSARMKRLMESVRATPHVRAATVAEAKAAMAVARGVLPGLMDDATLERLLAHNPDILPIVSGAGIPAGKTVFNGLIPLTEAGAQAIVSGGFRGSDPDLAHVCRPGETPAAIYAALVFTPAAFGPAMKALTFWIGRMAPQGCALFTRVTTGHTNKLVPAMGFLRADTLYPGAPADLLVVLPESGTAAAALDEKTMPAAAPALPAPRPARRLSVRVARNMEDVMKVFTVRAATYMSEQYCPYDEEFDGNDFCAMHLLGEVDGEVAGCLRMRFFGGFVKIERLAVRSHFRSTKLAFRLVREGIEICRQKGYRQAYGHSRADLTRFWGVFGFREIAGSSRFSFSDVDYVEMRADLEPLAEAVAIGVDPFVIIRPEGRWSEPGPLDRSSQRGSAASVAGQIRTIGGGRAQ
ncbi:GNAT family N-acetyltransferase [Sphingomonas naphthae]|uniref:GNAT family N-acetyltransferase n=1 Tax=Sphingomonas naphthae TaxID=1813468 RepID=A0ABY7TFD7_9SPHN|nr:GNAT family N-acetyltransferase [Sphingomonas naphthae]WCT71928.1 GNAT family N-acetyltransferase [Sphingomonas naphthae]